VLVDKVLFLAEVGDSRGYLLRNGQLKQLTKDQSLVNQLIEAGHLTEAEAEAFEHSNIILQALGTSETVQVDLTFVELRRGDRLMMCSDGLSGLVHADALRSAMTEIKDPAECCGKLIEYAETAGGHDNITVVIADFDGEALAPAAEGDSFGYVQYPLPLADGESSAFVDEDTERSSGEGATCTAQPEPATVPPRAAAPRKPRDQGESLLPLSGDAGDGQGNVIWIVVGALALAAGVAVWLSLEPKAQQRHDQEEAARIEAYGTPEDEPAATPAAVAPEPSPQAVEVQIHTDVQGATLLVNGEEQGALGSTEGRTLKLPPGAYRFEALSEGNPAAVSIVTVQGDTPMDVFLQLPTPPEAAPAAQAAAPEPEGAAPTAPKRREREARAEPTKGSAEVAPAPAATVAPKAAAAPAKAAHAPTPATPAVADASDKLATPAPAAVSAPAAAAPAAAPARPAARRTAPAAGTPAPNAEASAQEIPDNPF